jgi:glycosyltransferase involved in cell wall biosynthesis
VPGRLLLVLAVPMRGGAEDYALTIGRAAAQRGWTVHAALPFAEGTRTLCRDLTAANITCSPITPVNPATRDDSPSSKVGKLRAAAGLVRIVRRFRPDVAHVTLTWPTFGFAFLLAAAALRLPTLVTFQLVPDGLAVGPQRRRLSRWTLRRRQRWVAVSDHGRRLIAGLYDVDPAVIRVIHNGVSSTPSGATDGQRHDIRAAVRAELDVPMDATLLLSVGRLHRQKGQVDLVRAAGGVHVQRPDVRVLIAGEGPDRTRLEETLDALGLRDTVSVLGHRDDVARLMDAADLFVFPSHFEGTPFAMLEAMANGLPVVATTFGGAEEVIDDGRTGILVPVGEPDALRDAILAALADRDALQRMAKAGRERTTDFSREAMIDATLAELEVLCAS